MPLIPTPLLEQAMGLALNEAWKFRGATSPNPPVGACALTVTGAVLAVAAHERAGEAHAERKVIDKVRELGRLDELHTVVVTLEPCNHTGRTPPCVEAILHSPCKQVVYGVPDPNPKVAGGGALALQNSGLEVFQASQISKQSEQACKELVQAFAWWIQTGLPWVTLKTAHRENGSMLPPPGRKTFSAESSLHLAHQLRRRADAILTGSGTVVQDLPHFTVRKLTDHVDKKRILVVLDRRGRVPADWIQSAQDRGFEVWHERASGDLGEILQRLGKEAGVLEVLVEAGPTLSDRFLNEKRVNQHFRIQAFDETGGADRIESECLLTATDFK